MKNRIKEILKELKEICVDENLSISHDTLLREALTCYRGEKAGGYKLLEDKTKQNNPKPATDKQITYAKQLAEKKNIDLKLRGNETTQELSNIISKLKNE